MSAIARSLGMSHANVYRHFKSRDALLIAVAETWMAHTRAACEQAYQPKASTADNLAALVFTIRSELLKRADNIAALDLFHFALDQMPQAAKAHHQHRKALISKIIGGAEHATTVLDALRGFIDPDLLLATQAADTDERVKQLCSLLAKQLQSERLQEMGGRLRPPILY
ncbi:MAG: TetR/AcrR family transcriptional regulator [Pseudomonadota bacterium]